MSRSEYRSTSLYVFISISNNVYFHFFFFPISCIRTFEVSRVTDSQFSPFNPHDMKSWIIYIHIIESSIVFLNRHFYLSLSLFSLPLCRFTFCKIVKMNNIYYTDICCYFWYLCNPSSFTNMYLFLVLVCNHDGNIIINNSLKN